MSRYYEVLMSTFSRPVYDENGEAAAVIGADVPMQELSSLASQFYKNLQQSIWPIVLLQLIGLLVLGFIIYRSIASVRRLNEAQAEKDFINRELGIASRIQQAMLPTEKLDDGTVDIAGSLVPAKLVGGDFFDYVVRDSKLFFNIGDVCGKGNLSGKDNVLLYPTPRVWFEDRCKEVAGIINEFVDENGQPIPFIFRLWHEWEDSWMWWGAKYVSADDYKRFFILTEQIIRKYAPNAQILWAYCSDRFVNNEKEFMSRYPGDSYVDVIGFDDYAIGKSNKDWKATVNRAKMVSKIAQKRNMATALFETNNNKRKVPNYYTEHLNRMLKTKGVNLSIVQIWSLKNFNDSIDMKSFINQKNIIIR
jgi:hypothetical protein